MNKHTAAGLLIRMFCIGIFITILLLRYPGVWMKTISPLVGIVATTTSPYLHDITATAEGSQIRMRGEFHIEMTQANGSPLPVAILDWHKYSWQTMMILVISLAVWAAPVVSAKRRLLVLPVTLMAAALVCALDLAIETQVAALHFVGTQWLSGFQMMPNDANISAFASMQSWFKNLNWIKAFFDSGGRLFLAVLTGLIGFARLSWRTET